MNTTSTPTSHRSTSSATSPRLWAVVTDELRERRRARAERRELQRELFSYDTPAQVDDLLAALEGRDDAAAEEIRTILSNNLSRRGRIGFLAA